MSAGRRQANATNMPDGLSNVATDRSAAFLRGFHRLVVKDRALLPPERWSERAAQTGISPALRERRDRNSIAQFVRICCRAQLRLDNEPRGNDYSLAARWESGLEFTQ
jgi:hypothetical protein